MSQIQDTINKLTSLINRYNQENKTQVNKSTDPKTLTWRESEIIKLQKELSDLKKQQTQPNLSSDAKTTQTLLRDVLSGYIITESIKRKDSIQSATAKKIDWIPFQKIVIELTLNYSQSSESVTSQVIKLQDDSKVFTKQSSDLLYTHNGVKYNYLKCNDKTPITFFGKYFFYNSDQDSSDSNNGFLGGFSNHRKYHKKNIKPKTHTKRKYKSRKTLRKRKSKKT